MAPLFWASSQGQEPIANLVETHAENYNGTGFPARKTSEEIPLGARIIRICDGCDTFAMFPEASGDREATKAYLAEKRGVVHDPRLFPIALDYLEEFLDETKTGSFKTVAASELVSGMTVAENVYDADGRFLVRQGAILKDYLVKRLRRLLTSREVRVKDAGTGQ